MTQSPEIRQALTELDERLLTLLSERRALFQCQANEGHTFTVVQNTPPYPDQLQTLHQTAESLNLPKYLVTQIYQHIWEDEKTLQAQPEHHKQDSATQTVAFLGQQGSYSHLASLRYCQQHHKQLSALHCENFRDIFQSVESGQAQWGILPIENTSSGSINEVYDLLQHTPVAIIGEVTIPIEHTLLTAGDTHLERITTVYSHPQPHQQCSEFLHRLGNIHQIHCASTAEAMATVAKLKSPHTAAIGHADSGQWYGLTPLQSNIANQQENWTRFIVVARKARNVSPHTLAKTTLIMTTSQQVGALVDSLMILKEHNININKLESRPIIGNPWEEMFYLDLEAHLEAENTRSALKLLTEQTTFLKILGCYPSEKKRP